MTANTIPAWAQTQYSDEIIHVIQDSGGRLKGTTTEGTMSAEGDKIIWRVSGSAEAQEITTTSIQNVPLMNPSRSVVEGTFKTFTADSETSALHSFEFTSNELEAIKKTSKKAVDRTYDRQQMLHLFEQKANFSEIDASATTLSPTHIMTALGELVAQGYGDDADLYCAMDAMSLQQLRVYPELSSSDYAGDNQLLMKKLGAFTWQGCTFIPMMTSFFDTNLAGGTLQSNPLHHAFIWSKSCFGSKIDARAAKLSSITYDPKRRCWYQEMTYRGSFQQLLPEGFRKIKHKKVTSVVRAPGLVVPT